MTDSNAPNAPLPDSPNIHPTARLGQHCVVESDVEIAPNTTIGHNVVLRSGVRIGEGCLVLDGAILGKLPAKASLSALTGEARELPPLVLGRGVTVGANSVLYRGATLGDGVFVGDLASIRDADALAKLPEPEQAKWKALWAGVDELLEKASKGP